MYIKSLKLTNFRSWQKVEVAFDTGFNFLIGPNTIGKTNILEAIFLTASTRPFVNHRLNDLIYKDSCQTKIEAVVIDASGYEHLLMVNLIKDRAGSKISRSYLVGGTRVTRKRFLNELEVVLFEPADLNFISGSPNRRRQMIDRFLAELDWEYHRSLGVYKKSLRQRNQVLSQIKRGQINPRALWPWNKTLVKHGQLIQSRRGWLIDYFNRSQNQKNSDIRLEYQKSALDDNLINNPDHIRQEIKRETTLWGAHRDDFIFYWKDEIMANFSSRGQQRLAILELFLTQKQMIEESKKQKPVLLLDDVLSELDLDFSRRVIAELSNGNQVIIADVNRPGADLPKANIIDLSRLK